MNKLQTKQKIIIEVKYMLGIFLVLFIFFKAHYNQEQTLVLLKLTLSNFYLFIIPGYCLMLTYLDKLKFYERFIIGMGLGYGGQPLALYWINTIINVNIIEYNELISAGMLILGLGLFYFSRKLHQRPAKQESKTSEQIINLKIHEQ